MAGNAGKCEGQRCVVFYDITIDDLNRTAYHHDMSRDAVRKNQRPWTSRHRLYIAVFAMHDAVVPQTHGRSA